MKWFPKGQSPSGWQLLNGTQEIWLFRQFWENMSCSLRRRMANEILESLVSGFNLDIQHYIKFWGDTRNDIAQKGHVYTGMCYV